MKRIAQYAAYVLLLLASGCAALGIPQPQTFNQKIAVAYSDVTSARQVAASLVGIGKITPDDATNVQNLADKARDGIEIARQLHGKDAKAGEAKLASITVGLTALRDYLKGRQ